MKQIKVIASLLAAALLPSSAAFAHLSLKGEMMPILTPAYNWTGFYAGLNAGAVNHTMDITDTQAATFQGTLHQVSNPAVTGGLQIGYRRQLDMSYVSGVYGLEFDANISDATFSEVYGSAFSTYQLNSKNTLQNVYLLELTGGIAADRTLLFLAAGISWVKITGTTTNLDSIPFFNSFSVAKKELGTVFGAGVEYAFTDNVSARLKADVITPNTYSTQDNTGDSYEISNSIVQATLGINYKFA